MERLTKHDIDLGYYVLNDFAKEETWRATRTNETITVTQGDAIGKLAEYEDAEQDGRLIVLPCKVGDAVPMVHGEKMVKD